MSWSCLGVARHTLDFICMLCVDGCPEARDIALYLQPKTYLSTSCFIHVFMNSCRYYHGLGIKVTAAQRQNDEVLRDVWNDLFSLVRYELPSNPLSSVMRLLLSVFPSYFSRSEKTELAYSLEQSIGPKLLVDSLYHLGAHVITVCCTSRYYSFSDVKICCISPILFCCGRRIILRLVFDIMQTTKIM